MNTISKITLIQFRNYGAASFNFDGKITCITGANGSGKTNLLDAVYYICYTKSYFSAYQQHSIQNGKDGFRLDGILNKNDLEEFICCKWRNNKKEVTSNGAEYEKLTDHIGKYAAVMIAPDDMNLINDGSEGRRKWIDSILCQTNKEYFESLMQYQRVLLQRNAWLKMHAPDPPLESDELFYYNDQLCQKGAIIFEKRKNFIGQFRPLLEMFYQKLSTGKEHVVINYKSDLHGSSMKDLLHGNSPHDIRLQRTLKGIHKDDLLFGFNEMDLRQFASQGQKKSYLFALKLAQYAYLNKVTGFLPILLLDDIFEKLDQTRMEALLAIISKDDFGQVILTDTHAERVKTAFGENISLQFIQL